MPRLTLKEFKTMFPLLAKSFSGCEATLEAALRDRDVDLMLRALFSMRYDESDQPHVWLRAIESWLERS